MDKIKKWLGTEDPLPLKILTRKYFNEEESFDKFLDRVSKNNASVKDLILDKKFIFGGRILASRGLTDRKVSLSNCYVITPPEDSIEYIFECATKLARTYSYGGKTTTLPPYIVICSKKFSEPVYTGCVFIIC